jgi:hypothetical protein
MTAVVCGHAIDFPGGCYGLRPLAFNMRLGFRFTASAALTILPALAQVQAQARKYKKLETFALLINLQRHTTPRQQWYSVTPNQYSAACR